MLSNAIVLINESVEILGLKIWGSPTTRLYGGAFGMSAEADWAKLYAQIPEETDIVVTHGPPFGILDGPSGRGEGMGSSELARAVRLVKPRLHLFGHVHGSYGSVSDDDTLYVNAALLGVDGDLDRKPFVLELSRV